MLKEFEPIQQIEQRKKNLSLVLEEANALVSRVGLKYQNMKEQVGTSIEATIAYGKYHKSTENVRRVSPIVVERLTRRYEQFDQEAEPVINTLAQSYIERVIITDSKIVELRKLQSEGHLTKDEILPHEQEFEELLKFSKSHPLLQRGIQNIDAEYERKRKEKAEDKRAFRKQSEERSGVSEEDAVGSNRFQIPDGIKLGQKEQELFDLLSGTSLENPINGIMASQCMYLGEDIDLAFGKFRAIRYILGKKLDGHLVILRTAHTTTALDHLDGFDYYFKKFEAKDVSAQKIEPERVEVRIYNDPNPIIFTRMKSGNYMLDNGETFGIQSVRLLVALGETSEENPKTSVQLIDQVYPGKDRKKAITSLNHLINDTARKSLMGTDLEIGRVKITESSKSEGVLGYYLRRNQHSQTDINNQTNA